MTFRIIALVIGWGVWLWVGYRICKLTLHWLRCRRIFRKWGKEIERMSKANESKNLNQFESAYEQCLAHKRAIELEKEKMKYD
jgi:hypothetical protein